MRTVAAASAPLPAGRRPQVGAHRPAATRRRRAIHAFASGCVGSPVNDRVGLAEGQHALRRLARQVRVQCADHHREGALAKPGRRGQVWIRADWGEALRHPRGLPCTHCIMLLRVYEREPYSYPTMTTSRKGSYLRRPCASRLGAEGCRTHGSAKADEATPRGTAPRRRSPVLREPAATSRRRGQTRVGNSKGHTHTHGERVVGHFDGVCMLVGWHPPQPVHGLKGRPVTYPFNGWKQ